ncbi:hypothetical protein [Polaromonas sp. SM01]|uniref:hypothetical protein n=1 Tax=Polaromonas sp. SM01 TaxID=3085630 RepID=UPI0029824D22|nr:hypothetical protein [Polaromonas sp. SM01]MDW5442276.1 hypothetical protein [Polaromonas sp. SM01]
MSTPAFSVPSSVSLYDARPFFEKALQYGVLHGLLDAQKLDAMRSEAPKGMVQIARYFGSEFLRPELEKARDRMVNLVSLYLESSCDGDLRQAAESLRDHSLLSRSKGGSDMLKALIAMPQNSHFGMNERGGFTNEHIPLLAKWSLRSLADYQAELAKRAQVAQVIDAAIWLADQLGLEADDLEEAGKDAEAVIRTALLMLATGRSEMPDWISFEKTVAALRKKQALPLATGKTKAKVSALTITLPAQLPAHLRAAVEVVRQSVIADIPKILDPALPARQLFDRSPAFMGRYFWVEDGLNEVDHHDRQTSAAWHKATGGNSDDGSLLTLFLCVAAAAPLKTLLTEKGAAGLVRKIQKSGIQPDLAHQYILEHAPAQHQDGYLRLWADFVDEAQQTLQSDAVHALQDAVALLRRECHVK